VKQKNTTLLLTMRVLAPIMERGLFKAVFFEKALVIIIFLNNILLFTNIYSVIFSCASVARGF